MNGNTKKRLITSALPYVNNIPHLGNLIQVLSADVFARFCRMQGYETLYVCGTDEYGTATETRALEEGITPKQLCDRYYNVHNEIYQWFNIAFDRFGRTCTEKHTEITQRIFNGLDRNGYIKENTIQQLYCESCSRFLADRYVRGICPACGYGEARGDQCESCGKLLDPTDLVSPGCGTCGRAPILKETKHLYIDLPAVLPLLETWMGKASVEGFWANNAIQMTKSWIRDGLKERGITRDLKWGIPVPKSGYENKVFYVWFDAPIGYISITANHTDEWEKWWMNPEEVELFQFIGKDNIPFHTVIFPCSLLGSGEEWTLLHHMSSTEYLNYEAGKFSKSKGVGVFGTDARETGIPADIWRFYIFYNRPEKSDAVFTWKDFQEKVNGELIGNLSNLINRTISFLNRFYDGKIPDGEIIPGLAKEVVAAKEEITTSLDRAELRDAFRRIFALSSFGNKLFQDGEPWKIRESDPEKAAGLLKSLIYLIRDLAIMVNPYIPSTSDRISGILGGCRLDWNLIGTFEGLEKVGPPVILFEKLEDSVIEELRQRFSGSQKERKESAEMEKYETEMKNKAAAKTAEESGMKNGEKTAAQGPEIITTEEMFRKYIDLRIGKIVEVSRHPEADKLYIEKVDLGGEERQIVSGLVPYYREDELLGRNIVLVYNLKAAKLRGVESKGMLLAADAEQPEVEEPVEKKSKAEQTADVAGELGPKKDSGPAENGGKKPPASRERDVEVIFADWAEPGSRVCLSGDSVEAMKDVEQSALGEIKVDRFFSIPLTVRDNIIYAGETPVTVSGKQIRTERVVRGTVG